MVVLLYPFTEAGWHLFDRAAKLRLSLQDADAAPNCLNSAFRCIEAGRCEKVPEPRDIEESGLGPSQRWHSGGAAFSPASSCASQASASSAVTCSPVDR